MALLVSTAMQNLGFNSHNPNYSQKRQQSNQIPSISYLQGSSSDSYQYPQQHTPQTQPIHHSQAHQQPLHPNQHISQQPAYDYSKSSQIQSSLPQPLHQQHQQQQQQPHLQYDMRPGSSAAESHSTMHSYPQPLQQHIMNRSVVSPTLPSPQQVMNGSGHGPSPISGVAPQLPPTHVHGQQPLPHQLVQPQQHQLSPHHQVPQYAAHYPPQYYIPPSSAQYYYTQPQYSNMVYSNNLLLPPQPFKPRKKSKHSTIWTSKEDRILRELKEVQKLGWREMSSYFEDRTPNACQFRWRRLVSGVTQTSPKSKHSGLIGSGTSSRELSHEEELHETEDDGVKEESDITIDGSGNGNEYTHKPETQPHEVDVNNIPPVNGGGFPLVSGGVDSNGLGIDKLENAQEYESILKKEDDPTIPTSPNSPTSNNRSPTPSSTTSSSASSPKSSKPVHSINFLLN